MPWSRGYSDSALVQKVAGSNNDLGKLVTEKLDLSSVSEADREIPTGGKMDDAGNDVYRVFGIIPNPRVRISRSASETEV